VKPGKENMEFDLISIGDATIDVFISPIESSTMCKMDTKECLICFSYGDKIPTKELVTVAGGNSSNNAVGATRLGIKTSIVLTLGDDNIGNLIIDNLKNENVDMHFVKREPDSRSNYNTVINYSGERTIFVYHAPRNYVFPEDLPNACWYYLTSMGEEYKPFYDKLAGWLGTHSDIDLAFNPGSWQLRGGVEAMAPILKVTKVLFVNREEAEKMTNFGESHGKEKELLQAVCKLGVKTPIITDGGDGVFAFDGNSGKCLKAGVLPVDAYERTGAGDSFGSGCLSALVKKKSLEEALLWGTLNSASVIGYTGPQKGLLRDSEMPVWLERARSSEVEVKEF